MRLFDQLYLSLNDMSLNLNIRYQALAIGFQFQSPHFPIHRVVLDGYFHELDLEDECLRASLKNAMYDFD